MAKALSEHRATVKSKRGKKRKQELVEFEEHHSDTHIEPVTGGHVRRIFFEGREPTEEHIEVEETGDRTYHPKHTAPMNEIEFEIDNIHRRRMGQTPLPSSRKRSSETVYSTERGNEVRAAYAPNGRREKRVLYVTEDKGHYREEKRFNEADVDRIIANVSLDPEVEVITESKTEMVPRKRTVVEKVPVNAAEKGSKLRKSKKAKTFEAVEEPAELPDHYYDYKGDVHPVIEIEGIGPKYAAALNAAGIETSARLCFEDAAAIAAKIGGRERQVRQWQVMSELAKVKGIGPQYAEAMARSGIAGIQELKDRSPDALADQINDYLSGLGNSVIGNKITAKRIATWKENAKPMRRVRQPAPEN